MYYNGEVKGKRGAIEPDLLWIVGILLFIFYAWWAAGGPDNYEARKSRDSDTRSATVSSRGTARSTQTAKQNPPNTSPWYKVVKISSRGNSAKEKWADFEYITLRNTGKTPVTISGWTLKNGRDSRVFLNSLNQLTYGISDSAVIPYGVKTLWATVAQAPAPIVLEPREQAIITTGKITKRASYLNSSFKENICSGYLNELPGYALQPKLSSSCPRPRDDADLDLLDDGCYAFVRGLRACHTPVYREEVVRTTGELRQYLDKTYGLSRQCQEYVRKRFTYEWCVLTHLGDAKFYRPQWRVYLGRSLQLWNSGRESIRLYDANGLLVDEVNY